MSEQEEKDELLNLGLLKAPRLNRASHASEIMPEGIPEFARLARVDVGDMAGQWMLFHPNGIANIVYQRFQLQTYEQWRAAIIAATEL